VAIDSKTPLAKRVQTVIDFKDGIHGCLVNVNLFGEDFGCPDVEDKQMA